MDMFLELLPALIILIPILIGVTIVLRTKWKSSLEMLGWLFAVVLLNIVAVIALIVWKKSANKS